jgi:hypothetical protein
MRLWRSLRYRPSVCLEALRLNDPKSSLRPVVLPGGDSIYRTEVTNYCMRFGMLITVKVWSAVVGYENLQSRKWVTNVCRSVFLLPCVYTG